MYVHHKLYAGTAFEEKSDDLIGSDNGMSLAVNTSPELFTCAAVCFLHICYELDLERYWSEQQLRFGVPQSLDRKCGINYVHTKQF